MDYETLLNIRIKYGLAYIVISLLFISWTIVILNKEYYDSYQTFGIVDNSIIYINIPLDYSDTLKNGEYLKINNKEYDYQILEISNIEVDSVNYINYQTYAIEIDEELLNNEVLTITFYYNKEKNYQKLKRIIWKESKWKH